MKSEFHGENRIKEFLFKYPEIMPDLISGIINSPLIVIQISRYR